MATKTAPNEEIQEVWAQYKTDPGNIELRNRLIEAVYAIGPLQRRPYLATTSQMESNSTT
jgi:hypothetical protein